MEFIVLILIAILCSLFTASCEKENNISSLHVRLETTLGMIVLELNRIAAPKTVDNFLSYVERGFYNGTLFHRVIKGFMIQGGGLNEKMNPKETQNPVLNEADNGLKNEMGTIAMARTSSPHSATSQFFINTANNVFLNHRNKTTEGYGYCVFGKVIKGMDVVQKIEDVRTTSRSGYDDVPVEPVIIREAVLEK
jgi:peptidyl-prolyl cis-trans isomerase B (cyclophilin B)